MAVLYGYDQKTTHQSCNLSVVPWALKYSLMPTSLAGILILAD